MRSSSEYDRDRRVQDLSASHASPGFLSLQRLQNRGATYPGITSPGYAASSGFRTLLTLCSPQNLSALFQTVTLLGFCSPKVSPPTAWIRPLDQPYPHGVGSNGPVARLADDVLARLPGVALRGSPLPPSLHAAGVARSSPELFCPSRGFSLASTAPLNTGASSHGL